MTNVEIIKDLDGNDYVIITNEDGSELGMRKEVYDAQLEAQREQSGTL